MPSVTNGENTMLTMLTAEHASQLFLVQPQGHLHRTQTEKDVSQEDKRQQYRAPNDSRNPNKLCKPRLSPVI